MQYTPPPMITGPASPHRLHQAAAQRAPCSSGLIATVSKNRCKRALQAERSHNSLRSSLEAANADPDCLGTGTSASRSGARVFDLEKVTASAEPISDWAQP